MKKSHSRVLKKETEINEKKTSKGDIILVVDRAAGQDQ